MTGWFTTVKASRLYGLFLRHRIWTARMIIASKLLYCFPLGCLAIVWIMLPVTVIVMSVASAVQDSGTALPAIFFLNALFFIALAPITVNVVIDLFRGYVAGLYAVFGRATGAQNFLRSTQSDHSLWERQYA